MFYMMMPKWLVGADINELTKMIVGHLASMYKFNPNLHMNVFNIADTFNIEPNAARIHLEVLEDLGFITIKPNSPYVVTSVHIPDNQPH